MKRQHRIITGNDTGTCCMKLNVNARPPKNQLKRKREEQHDQQQETFWNVFKSLKMKHYDLWLMQSYRFQITRQKMTCV